MAVFPGTNWNTLRDKPLVIGAHWDVVPGTHGFNDNGSGVSVLLELARILPKSKCFKPKNTILFVAFDSEEAGSLGSYEFVRRLVMPYFRRRGLSMSGAIILDTLMNFDDRPNSQIVPQKWLETVPEFANSVLANERRGDFVAMIRRSHPNEAKIAQSFAKNMELVSSHPPLKLTAKDLELKGLPFDEFPSGEDLYKFSGFWRSDHSRFWYYREQTMPGFLDPAFADNHFMPSVLLTDTGAVPTQTY